MASDETMNIIHSSYMHEDDDVDEDEDEDDHHQHTHKLSRLSICSNQSMHENDEDVRIQVMGTKDVFALSSDADEEDFSSDEKDDEVMGKGVFALSSDSDEVPGCFSLPATPPPRQRSSSSSSSSSSRILGVFSLPIGVVAMENWKDYASENEVKGGGGGGGGGGGVSNKLSRSSRRKVTRERWLERAWEKKKKKEVTHDEDLMKEEDEEKKSSECLLITKPNGGNRSLCMDMDEVKACRDLGFELEHEMRIEIPSRISVSGSTIDTSSGGNSPTSNWRISSPGDDPKDVKARLKVWAQAVALASASRSVS